MTGNTPLVSEIRDLMSRLARPVRLMEVCGTHTMTAFRTGLRSLLPAEVTLLSGPGCPVCVTPVSYVDRALALAAQPGTLICTYGDMVRVPGSTATLEQARARGAMIRIVYSVLDALEEARQHPEWRVVFLGLGFETTAPATAWAAQTATLDQIANFYVLGGHKTMPQAMAALLAGGEVAIDGFLCPGHVSVITGTKIYEFICRDYRRPCVVTGFEGADMVEGIAMLLRQLAAGRSEVENQYRRSVKPGGNEKAQTLLAEVFCECDAEWRGLGLIPGSGLQLREAYAACDANRLLVKVDLPPPVEPAGCRCGEVIRGAVTPLDCPLFRRVCTPDRPVGACMVSSEGTCAAYYKYGGPGVKSEK